MTTAVVTITIGDFYQGISEVTHPMIKGYADKIKSDFIVLRENKYPIFDYNKFELYNILRDYQRVLFIDTDVIIHPETPNIFNVVPEDKIGMVNERPLGYDDRFEEFLRIYGKQYLEKWLMYRNCYNAGVIVCSQQHQKVFEPPTRFIDHYQAQSFINLRMIQNKVNICQLPYQYNRLAYFDLTMKEHRLHSFIVHYAGLITHRPLKECQNFLNKEYRMMLSKNFSEDQLRLEWRYS